MQRATARMLPDDERLHLQHGPIDLIVQAWGPGRDAAYRRAVFRFEKVLEELVLELSVLRRYHVGIASVYGSVAKRMAHAVAPFSMNEFVTPMAAVAGAVADEILSEIQGDGVAKAYVNNGGDIAFHLSADESLSAAVASQPSSLVRLRADSPVRGIATSGWGGRSHSLGIADSVTVLAGTSAMADVAATLISNAVDLPGHPDIERAPATDLSPDSDLKMRLVTTAVPVLSIGERASALAAGLGQAEVYKSRGLIQGAYLTCQGDMRAIGAPLTEMKMKEMTDA